MNWEAIGAVGEVIGAAAVVVSIVYLSIQIRQNTKSTKLAVEQEIAASMSRFVLDMAPTSIPHIYIKGADDLSKLSDEEVSQFGFFMIGIFRIIQQAFDQRRDGNLGDRTWESIERSFVTQLRSPGVQAYWKVRGDTFKDEFQDYVNSLTIDENISSPVDAVNAMKGNIE